VSQNIVANIVAFGVSSALPETPFGGIKDSGYGHEGGIEGLNVYMTAKFVSHMG
jgi:succinate-semialdehyde dehydrogenase / glutarate-semialdehyde dehydrogenase